MNTTGLFLKVLGLVLLIIAGLGVSAGRYSLLAFGLAAWLASEMVP